MARGKMIILRGIECKNQTKYCNLDKIYEFKILFNLTTDTYDILGLIKNHTKIDYKEIDTYLNNSIKKYIGEYEQEFPPFSSFCINKKPLWLINRDKIKIEKKIPKKNITIYNLEYLGFNMFEKKNLHDLIFNTIHTLNRENFDNFRVPEILHKWHLYFETINNNKFKIYKFKAKVSSGTYIRSLANRIGNDLGIGAIVFDINRTNFL